MENIAMNFISYIFTLTSYWSRNSNIFCYSIYHFGWYIMHSRYNFITRDYWSINNTFEILVILTNTSGKIATIIFLALTIVFTFTLTCFIMPFLIWITSCTIDLSFKITWNMLYQCFASFLFVIISNTLTLVFCIFRDTYFEK